jgi:iron complex transport system ATP-binding protein
MSDPNLDEAILQVDDVSFAYDGHQVLERVDLRLSRGESVGILGENGCGKTTLLRLMARLLEPDKGKIALYDRDITDYRQLDLAREISVVGQGTESIFDFSVEDVVLMGRNPYIPLLGGATKGDREKVEQSMERMQILESRDKPVTHLSAGEFQRVLIARSLAQATPILLLDEPTSSLDVRHQIELVYLLRELLEKEEKTIVTVSHDINLIAHLASRAVLIGRGGILASGPVGEIICPERLYETYGVRMVVESGDGGMVIRLPWDEAAGGGS